MGKLEKLYVIFSLAYTLVYSYFFFNLIESPENFERIIPFHILGMVLSLGFIIVIIRDVFKRKFPTPNAKAMWAILLIIFWPIVLIYLPKYGFKPRDTVPEPGGNTKYIIGSVLIAVVFFGYMGYSMYSAIKGFEHQEESINSLASSGKNEEIIERIENGKVDIRELNQAGKWSPLHSAVSNNRIITVRLLIENGADVNQQCDCNGDTPLHIAARKGFYEIIVVLLSSGAKESKAIKNDNNKTPYDLASDGGFSSTAQLLSI